MIVDGLAGSMAMSAFEGHRTPLVHAGRQVPRVYRTTGRSDLHAFLVAAVEASGGAVLYCSEENRAPIYVGVQVPSGERLGLLVYPIRVNKRVTKNRPPDEVRGQLRYGSEHTWHMEDHAVARDIAGVDTTLMLGLYIEESVIIAVDPALYDPMPLGITAIYLRDALVEEVHHKSWHVWTHENAAGTRREAPRTQDGIETVVAFEPHRLLDYVRFERHATALGLDAPLRFRAADDAGAAITASEAGPSAGHHILETDFDLSAGEILEMISRRRRLAVAVRGGVAEHHLEKALKADPKIRSVEQMDEDGQPDFRVVMYDGRTILVECKNISPEKYANGDGKVEVQKTRASKGDPASRLYRPEQFDVVAVCLYSITRQWHFRYIRSTALERSRSYPNRINPLQRVDDRWAAEVSAALAR